MDETALFEHSRSQHRVHYSIALRQPLQSGHSVKSFPAKQRSLDRWSSKSKDVTHEAGLSPQAPHRLSGYNQIATLENASLQRKPQVCGHLRDTTKELGTR